MPKHGLQVWQEGYTAMYLRSCYKALFLGLACSMDSGRGEVISCLYDGLHPKQTGTRVRYLVPGDQSTRLLAANARLMSCTRW